MHTPQGTNRRARRLRALLAAGACCAVAALAPASAGAASPAWSAAIDLGLPSGADPAAPDAVVDSVACGGPAACAAVGSYTDDTGTDQALLAARTAGGWSVSELSFPENADSTHPEPPMLSVACGAPGSCTAVGTYAATTGVTHAMVTSLDGGDWSDAVESALPTDHHASRRSDLSAVACPAAGSCVAVGSYRDSTGADRPMVATLANGEWSAERITPPSGATVANFLSIACGAAGSCGAVGFYDDGTGAVWPMATSLSNGVWSAATPIALPAGAHPTAPNGYMTSAACGAAGSCVAGGTYIDDHDVAHAIVASLAGASWSAATILDPPADAGGANSIGSVDAVACGAAGSCGAVGTYTDDRGDAATMVASQVGGTWSAATRLALPAGADEAASGASEPSLACGAAGACVLAASYIDDPGDQRPMVASQSNGAWSAASALELPEDAHEHPDAVMTSVACGAAWSCTAGGFYTDDSGSRRALIASAAPHEESAPPSTTPPTPPASGGGSGGGATAPVTGSAPSSPRPLIVLKSAKFAVVKGAIKVKLACQGAHCSGTIKLTAKAGGRTRILGKASYAIVRGRTATIAVRLRKAGKQALQRSRTRPVRAKLVISVRGAGSTTRTILVR